MIRPKTISQVIHLVLALCLGIGAAVFAGHYHRLKASAAQNVQREGVLVNTSAGVTDAETNAQLQLDMDAGLREISQQFDRRIKEVNKNDVTTANRSTAAVPVGLRNAYGERRRSRERLGCAGNECAPADTPATASERP